MSAFKLLIDGQNVNEYVDIESLQEFSQRVEGDGLWDYWLDTIGVDLDMSILPVFNLSESSFEQMDGKEIELYYYGNKVFGGTVGESEYDYDEEKLILELYSHGKNIENIPIAYGPYIFFETQNNGGDTIEQISKWLIYLVNLRQDLDAPSRLKQTAKINVIDFPFMKSVAVDALSYDKSINPNGTPLFPLGIYIEKATGLTCFIYANQPSARYARYYLNVNGIDNNTLDSPRLSVEFRNNNIELNGSIIFTGIPDWQDSQLEDYATNYLNEDIKEFFGGGYIPDDYFFAYVRTGSKTADYYFLKFNINQEDKYLYKYEDASAGQIIKDLAVVKNAIVWIGSDAELNYQSRDGLQGLGRMNVESASVVTEKREGEFEPPGQYIFLDQVKSDIISYYSEFLNATFKRYTITVDREQFSSSDYPLLLKNLPITVRGKNIDAGIIKAVTYKEDLLEIETEKRIG